MKIYLTTGENNRVVSWALTRGEESEIEIEIDDNHTFFKDNPFTYVYVDGELKKSDEIVLNLVKSSKLRELNTLCNNTITSRFSTEIDGVVYFFSNDLEAQSNFDKCDRAFEKGYMTEIQWTCYDSDGNIVRVAINPTNFPTLYMAHLNHIQSNISRFRDELMPLVENASTIEEVNSINW